MTEPLQIDADRLRRVLTIVSAAGLGFAEPFRVGIDTAIEEICERLSIPEPSEKEISLARLALDMDVAAMELVEKGEYEICGKSDDGSNLYRPATNEGVSA